MSNLEDFFSEVPEQFQSPTQKSRNASYNYSRKSIGKGQRRVLGEVVRYYWHYRKYPTTKQLAAFSGIYNLTVGARLNELRDLGYIKPLENPIKKKYGVLNQITQKGLDLVKKSM